MSVLIRVLHRHNFNPAQFDIYPCSECILNFGDFVRVWHERAAIYKKALMILPEGFLVIHKNSGEAISARETLRVTGSPVAEGLALLVRPHPAFP